MYSLNNNLDIGFTDCRFKGQNDSGITVGLYSDEATIVAELKTAKPLYYTDPVLASMTYNDLIFALRSEVDSAGFKS